MKSDIFRAASGLIKSESRYLDCYDDDGRTGISRQLELQPRSYLNRNFASAVSVSI
jgi:hypothetical protein